MQVTLAVLADAANVTAEGKLNVLGIFDRIRAEGYPWVHPQMFLVIRFRGDPADQGQTKTLQVQMRDEDGALMFGIQSELTIPENAGLRPSFDNVLGLAGLVIPRPGRYAFMVTINGQTAAEVELEADSPKPAGE